MDSLGFRAAMASASSSSSKLCFNSDCKELRPERPKKGWRLRSGELAELCDRCGLVILPFHYFVDSHSVLLDFFTKQNSYFLLLLFKKKLKTFHFCVSLYFLNLDFGASYTWQLLKRLGLLLVS